MKKYCTFVINGILFGIEVEKVIGVIPHGELIRVPLADRSVKGLIHYRGNVITTIDLRRKFEFPERETDKYVHVVVSTKRGNVSFLVDEMGEILELGYGAKPEVPRGLDSTATYFVTKAFRMEDLFLYILDFEKILDLRSEIKI